MLEYFKPDYYFEKYDQITTEFLKRNGIRTILSDLDSTLAIHNQGPDDAFKKWFKTLEQEEISLIIVSNNGRGRVESFAKPFHIVYYSKCGKPKTGLLEKELFEKGLKTETTLFLGDQIFTDMWCGKKLGIKTALVKPYGNHEPIQIKVKRIIEKIVLKRWKLKKEK